MSKSDRQIFFIFDGDLLPYSNNTKSSNAGSKSSELEDKLSVIETPGHTPGSTVLKVENATQKIIFTEDTLFEGSIGQTDVILGDYKMIMKSIMEKLYPLPDDFRVYPGHDNPTMMIFEKKDNPLMRYELSKKKQSSCIFIELRNNLIAISFFLLLLLLKIIEN